MKAILVPSLSLLVLLPPSADGQRGNVRDSEGRSWPGIEEKEPAKGTLFIRGSRDPDPGGAIWRVRDNRLKDPEGKVWRVRGGHVIDPEGNKWRIRGHRIVNPAGRMHHRSYFTSSYPVGPE